jgi:hypothetical protein
MFCRDGQEFVQTEFIEVVKGPLMNISVDVFNPDGSVPSLSGHWCLEIDLWCLV